MNLSANMSDCVYGDIDEPTGMLYDARTWKRATAQRSFANDFGIEFAQVHVQTRYARWLSRQEQWDESEYERRMDAADGYVQCPVCRAPVGVGCEMSEGDLLDGLFHEARAEAIPADPPGDWVPGEYVPAWAWCCDADHPAAVKVYFCEERWVPLTRSLCARTQPRNIGVLHDS